jgi:hypothetical protein
MPATSALSNQTLQKRYPDLPNHPDKAHGFNPGDSGNPDTKNYSQRGQAATKQEKGLGDIKMLWQDDGGKMI